MMTSRSRYALKIMLDLSRAGDETIQKRLDIARRQAIPSDYMDHILSSLREHELVHCVRGRGGGVALARKADQISVWEIFSAAESNMLPVVCLDQSHERCALDRSCMAQDAWGQIYQRLQESLGSLMLSDLLVESPDSGLGWESMDPLPAVQECRSPRREKGI